MTRQVRRYKERKNRKLLKNKNNQQYSYTTLEAIALIKDQRGDLDWLPSKEGLSIEQWWIERIKQQRTASNLAKAFPMGCFVVHNNEDTKLDDKIRNFICNLDIHQEVNLEDDGAGKEWILTNVSDIYEELNFYPKNVKEILSNSIFMEKWFNKVKNSKVSYFDDENTSNPYQLYPWQKDVVLEMENSGKDLFLLSLPPRFGKTISILEYLKRRVEQGVYKREELYLLPLSKSLSSNTSFFKDYKRFGFTNWFNIVDNISLFKDETKVIHELKQRLPENAKVVIVTDEADQASHTDISVNKMKEIISEFNIVIRISMTGTGIGKASKIFKGISIDDLCYIHKTYTELGDYESDTYVKRNFVNVQHKLADDELNFKQSFDDPIHYDTISKYLYLWTLDNITESRLGLQKTEAVMVGINTPTKKRLIEFGDYFKNKYSDECDVLVLCGKFTNNANAEDYTTKHLNTMRKNKDMRRLVVFTIDMGSRSYNESRIYRTVLCGDNGLTESKLQLGMRAATPEGGKKICDIIRISLSPFDMVSEVIMLENETLDYSKKSKKIIKKFVTNNSFLNVVVDDSGTITSEQLSDCNEDIGEILDKANKFNDTTSFWIPRLFGQGLVVDTNGNTPNKLNSKTKTVSTTLSNGKKVNTNRNNTGMKESEKKLRNYIDISRCIPSIAYIQGYVDISKFLLEGDWEQNLPIDKKLFVDNLKIESFYNFIDNSFDRCKGWDEEQHKERLLEYMKFIEF